MLLGISKPPTLIVEERRFSAAYVADDELGFSPCVFSTLFHSPGL
jgi:hypothetical protein